MGQRDVTGMRLLILIVVALALVGAALLIYRRTNPGAFPFGGIPG